MELVAQVVVFEVGNVLVDLQDRALRLSLGRRRASELSKVYEYVQGLRAFEASGTCGLVFRQLKANLVVRKILLWRRVLFLPDWRPRKRRQGAFQLALGGIVTIVYFIRLKLPVAPSIRSQGCLLVALKVVLFHQLVDVLLVRPPLAH